MRSMNFLKISAMFIGIPVVGMTAGTQYLYPELRNDYGQIVKALHRIYRVTKSGICMASVYMGHKEENMKSKHYRAAAYLRDAFQANAGIYIKFGQLISSLDFIIPEPYKETFLPFLAQCPETRFSEVKKQIKLSTGKELEEIFLQFDQKPISSASIAQVHKATLMSGQRVAVKIQHPWLQPSSSGDIKLLEIFVNIGEYLFPEFKYQWFIEELKVNVSKELDFKMEVNNIKQQAELLKNVKNFSVPKTFDHICGDRVITMEFIDGILLANVTELKKQGYDLQKISNTISIAFTKQIFENGFVHSDPHAGNIIIRGPPKNPEVVLIDHGLYLRVDDNTRKHYNQLWKSIIEQDEIGMQQSAIGLGIVRDYKLFTSMITSKPFDHMMDKNHKTMKKRLGRPTSQEELCKLKDMALDKHKEIVQILNDVSRPLLLLLKINEFLRNIDYLLGSPANSYYYTYDQACKVIFQQQLQQMWFLQQIAFSFRIWYHHLKLKFAKNILSYFPSMAYW